MSAHEDITVTIKDINSIQVLEDTRSRQVDFGLSLVPIEDPAVKCELISTPRSVCIAPKQHPLTKLSSVTPKDIADFPFISLSDLDRSKTKTNKLFENEGVKPRVVIQAGLMSTACHLVSQGLGVAIIDEISAKDHSHLDICAMPLEPGFEFTIYLVKPLLGRSSDLADKFMAHICENINHRLNQKRSMR